MYRQSLGQHHKQNHKQTGSTMLKHNASNAYMCSRSIKMVHIFEHHCVELLFTDFILGQSTE